jgi:hypothetical protein
MRPGVVQQIVDLAELARRRGVCIEFRGADWPNECAQEASADESPTSG